MMQKSIQESIQQVGEMQVVDCVEHDDGACTFMFEISEEAKQFLIQYALKHILEQVANQSKPCNAIDNA